MTTRCALLVPAMLCLTGCMFDTPPPGPTENESRSIDLDKSELVKVDLHMGAGEMRVSGGSPKLMDGDFTYNVPSWKPSLRYNNTGVRSYLTIEQPGNSRMHAGNTKYEWDVRLNDNVPMDMTVHFGAGEGKLKLGTLSLRSLEIHMGVGQLEVDLRGNPKRDYNVNIHGGVGEATVYLPHDAGIMAHAGGGIGGIDVSGLHKEDGRYVNDGYDKSKVKINLDIRGGVGSIHLIAD